MSASERTVARLQRLPLANSRAKFRQTSASGKSRPTAAGRERLLSANRNASNRCFKMAGRCSPTIQQSADALCITAVSARQSAAGLPGTLRRVPDLRCSLCAALFHRGLKLW
jgi:hypothetical protein